MTKNRIFFFSFFLILLFLIIFRAPCFFILGSDRGIEETAFYNFSVNNNFFKSIFYIYPYAGYLELWTNLSSELGTILTKSSRISDVYFALIAKLILFFYIFFSKSLLFYKEKYKIIAISLILFSPPMTPEVWLTTIHSKSYFGILTFVLIFQNFENLNSSKKNLYRFTLIFSGLCSIYSSIFAPIYFLKYFLKKSRDNFLNFLCISLPLLINFLIFINFSLSNSNQDRFSFEFAKVENFAYNILVRPIFGSSIPKYFYNTFNIQSSFVIVLSTIIILGFLILIIRSLYLSKDKISLLIVSSFFINTFFVFFGSLNSDFVGGRYAVIPGIIFLTLILRFFQIENNHSLKYIFGFLIFLSLSVGIVEFKYLTPLPELLSCKV